MPFYKDLQKQLAAFSDQDRKEELAKMQSMVDMVCKNLHDPQNWFHVKREIKVTL